MCDCHGTTFCPDEICIGYENDVPIYVRRDGPEVRRAVGSPSISVRSAALEEAAALLDKRAQEFNRERNPGLANHCRSLARAVRELK